MSKKDAHRLINQLPDNATWEDLISVFIFETQLSDIVN